METVNKKINMVNQGLLPPSLYKKRAKTSKKPVFTRERLRTKIHPIVITAWLLKPEIASSRVKTLNNNNRATADKDDTSNGRISRLNNTIINEMTKNNII